MTDGEAAKLPTNDELLQATLDLAQTQLIAQGTAESSLDGRTIGLLALNAALAAADVAARDLLGPAWWTPFFFVLTSSVVCACSVASKEPYYGPFALEFYTGYRTYGSGSARETLLASLDQAFQENALRIKFKKSCLRWALGILGVGLVVSALVILLYPPTKAGIHASTNGKNKTAASPGAHHPPCTVVASASGAERGSHVGPDGCFAPRPLVELAATIEDGEHGPLFRLAKEIEGTQP
jgi:hypothetical protein